jgi:hypothetical protein
MNRRAFLAHSVAAVAGLPACSRNLRNPNRDTTLTEKGPDAPPTGTNPARPPERFLDTTYAPLSGRTLGPVRGLAELLATYSQARGNDTILIDPDTPITDLADAVLRKKSDPGPIHIRPTNLTPAGQRVGPAGAGYARFIGSRPGTLFFRFEPGCHDIRWINCEFTPDPRQGRYGTFFDTIDCERIWFDRCYLHDSPTGQMRRALRFEGVGHAVIDSYIANIKTEGAETQAVWGANGPGPYKIVNNYLEAAGENIMFGGQSAAHRDVSPADIEIRGNHLTKPWSWWPRHPTYAGRSWTVKNLFELKHARRVLFTDNLLENCWEHAQTGFAIVLSVVDDHGRAPWTTVSDITVVNNIIRHCARGVSISGWDYGHPGTDVMRRVYIANNLFEDISQDYATWSARLNFIFSPGNTPAGVTPTEDQVFEHNTAVNCKVGQSLYFHDPHGGYVRRLRISNNILPIGLNPGWGDGGFFLARMAKLHAPDGEIRRNLFYGRGSGGQGLPSDNLLVRDQSAVRFTNSAGGDYRLAPDSPGKGRATDGRDIGIG